MAGVDEDVMEFPVFKDRSSLTQAELLKYCKSVNVHDNSQERNSSQYGLAPPPKPARLSLSPRTKSATDVGPVPSKLEFLRHDNERLRGLVTKLQSRLELLELSQTKMIELSEDVQFIKEALSESSIVKKDAKGIATLSEKSPLISHLQKFPTCDASSILDMIESDKSVYLSGWMNKKGRKVRNWKRRWFVLKGSKLSYYP